ncbi:phage head closure protein [Cupriavidus pauculus]|uniref:phage head closure protein n=1 Tax=Cupriavidus pauculus TaxID=82633 RepID=UPI003C6DA157
MRAGERSVLIEIQHNVATRDAAGQPIASWQTIGAQHWADVRHRSGIETMRADMPTSVVQVSGRIPYPVFIESGVDSRMRVLCEGDAYEIQAVLPDKKGRRYADLVCQLVPAKAD